MGSKDLGQKEAVQPLSDSRVDWSSKYSETSRLMTGDVGLSLILPESDGHAEDWAQDEIETALEEVCEGLVFLADYRMDTNLTFWLPEAVLVKPTSVEPVEENYDEHKWVEDIMEDLGYDCSYFPFFPKFNRRRCNYLFNDDKRAQYELDWYFTSYVIRDVNSDHFFKDGHFSVSWPWGPYSCTGSGSYQGYHQMSLEFYDDALCSLVQARVYPSGHPELVEVFLLNQEFKYSTADANPPTATLDPITKVFYLKDPGPYTCEVNVWDVNGGEKTRTYVSFMRLGGIVSVAGKETIRGLSLSAATPNPFSGRVQWHLASKRAQDLELSIVRVDGRVVRAWSETVVAGERKSIVWDGRNSLGQRVPVGMYYLQVRGRHEQREVKSVIYMY